MGRLSALIALCLKRYESDTKMKVFATILVVCLTLQLTPGHVAWVHDGDTIRFYAMRIWAGTAVVDQSVRLEGVDAEELTMKDATGAIVPNTKGLEAKAFTKRWLAVGPFDLRHCFKREKYGRPLAELTRQGVSLADELKARGLAK